MGNKTKIVRVKWECGKCKSVQKAYSHQRHQMSTCKCGESGVDLEQWYQRSMGSVNELARDVKVDGKWIDINDYEEEEDE